MQDKKKVIDEILSSLYEGGARGYFKDAEIGTHARRRIEQTLSTLDQKTRKLIESDAEYRLEQFEKFKHLGPQRKDEILKLAKQKKILIEDAYKISDASRN